MTAHQPSDFEQRSRFPLPSLTLAGILLALVSIVAIAFSTYQTLRLREVSAQRVTNEMEVQRQLASVLSTLKDAETGQRGFLLTGDEKYLEPYTDARVAFNTEESRLKDLLADNQGQLSQLPALDAATSDKLTELAETISLRRAGRVDDALAVVRSDRGKTLMDRARAVAEAMQQSSQAALAQSDAEWQGAISRSTQTTWGGAILLVLFITGSGIAMSRDYRAREQETWIRAGQAGLTTRMQGEQRLDVLGDSALQFLAAYLGAQVGAIYMAEAGRFRRFAGYALPPDALAEDVRPGDGLVGQAAKENRALHVTSVPKGYLAVSSSSGHAAPVELLVTPGEVDGVVQAVVELGFFRRLGYAERELLTRTSHVIGVAVRASRDRTQLENLLEETQGQAEELQTQQEELRVNNEELEEQSRLLKESQFRLEGQQAELEQINSHLEEQTQALEGQKTELEDAQVTLQAKTDDLERANRYKSEFLANMSHELRTPLNSSLILAKLLADNKQGNLTDEQIRFALTIFDAGNDLLTLINDILDLSKIEAGKIELSADRVSVAAEVDGLVKSFQPVAAEKGVAFSATVEPGVPGHIETDGQRLGQILKNLLSNAFKFTDHGEVSLRVSADASGVAFRVRDTGIGISPEQQAVIFEAFRQADGSTHRKYGGTGLGLSISRDLAELLGGTLTVYSAPGTGSTFSLIIPAEAQAQAPARSPRWDRASAPPAAPAARTRAVKPSVARTPARDDRPPVAEGRHILIIEDDERFASVLSDLGHEMGFECLVTHTAREGVAAAVERRPRAIVLDINLPDHSGLGVLDQLKHNPATRHIPVHCVSVEDYSRQAMELGAIGYALKPVRREELIDAFRRLEAKATQGMRRVLVVEDDARQRESIERLLGAEDVQVVGAGTAGAALEQLKASTFDCVVMDLKLPDMTGFKLLEEMADENDVSFPPVIIYTGRSLTDDEEHQLRRFSKSIIIKDARSPERLLDEVTLFLHQVESSMTLERQRMLQAVRRRDAALEGRRILIVEDDARNIFALTSVLEPKGAAIEIARNGREALAALERAAAKPAAKIDLVLMDIMMPEMDGLTAMREIRKRDGWRKLPIIALTAKAMADDQEKCLSAGANDYIAKPLDIEKLLSLVRVWMPK